MKISKPTSLEVAVGNTSVAGISFLPNNYQMQLQEKEWCELFGNSIEFTSSDRFSSDETEERETKQNSKNIIMRWTEGSYERYFC